MLFDMGHLFTTVGDPNHQGCLIFHMRPEHLLEANGL
jgi:hypothetical protein